VAAIDHRATGVAESAGVGWCLDDRSLRDVLLIALTAATGAVDAVSWLCLGKVFSAFMTGNIAFLAFRMGGAAGPSVPKVLASLLAFGLGALVAARIIRPTSDTGLIWPRRVTVALGAVAVTELAFLAFWIGAGGHPSAGAGERLIVLFAFAMGVQTGAVFSLGVRAVFTTATTATWAVLMADVVSWSSSRSERRRLAGVIAGLFAGAVAGTLLVIHARTWAPALPPAITVLVVAVAAVALRAPAGSRA
jgi:uncharacterized membrane protein YoaK (UPF0700 family)